MSGAGNWLQVMNCYRFTALLLQYRAGGHCLAWGFSQCFGAYPPCSAIIFAVILRLTEECDLNHTLARECPAQCG